MKLVPLSDRVVLKQCEAEETTESGIILTSASQEKPGRSNRCRSRRCGRRQGSYYAGKGRAESNFLQIRRYRSKTGRHRIYDRTSE